MMEEDLTIGLLLAKLDGCDPSLKIHTIVKMDDGSFVPGAIQDIVLRPEDQKCNQPILMAYELTEKLYE